MVHGSISSREHVREGKERVEVVADKAARAGIHFQFSTQPRSRAREFARRWARACSRSRFLIATRPASPSPWAGRGSIYQVVPGGARARGCCDDDDAGRSTRNLSSGRRCRAWRTAGLGQRSSTRRPCGSGRIMCSAAGRPWPWPRLGRPARPPHASSCPLTHSPTLPGARARDAVAPTFDFFPCRVKTVKAIDRSGKNEGRCSRSVPTETD